MKKIMNKKNNWDQVTNGDKVERISCAEIINTIKVMKTGKAARPNFETIAANGQIREKVMRKLCQRVLDGKGMPHGWKTSVVEPIYKRNVLNCRSYRGAKLLEHEKCLTSLEKNIINKRLE